MKKKQKEIKGWTSYWDDTESDIQKEEKKYDCVNHLLSSLCWTGGDCLARLMYECMIDANLWIPWLYGMPKDEEDAMG